MNINYKRMKQYMDDPVNHPLTRGEQIGLAKIIGSNITDWRDLKPGDIVWWGGDGFDPAGFYTVVITDRGGDVYPFSITRHDDWETWVDVDAEQWRFIVRPTQECDK